MKKIIKYIFIIMFVMITFTFKVNASLQCPGSINLIEASQADPTGFRATMPVCGRYEFREYYPKGTEGTYPEAAKIGREFIRIHYQSIDGKSSIYKYVPRCTAEDAYIGAVFTYNITYDGEVQYEMVNDYDRDPYDCTPVNCKNLGESTCQAGNAKNYCKWQPVPKDASTIGKVEIPDLDDDVAYKCVQIKNDYCYYKKKQYTGCKCKGDDKSVSGNESSHLKNTKTLSCFHDQ